MRRPFMRREPVRRYADYTPRVPPPPPPSHWSDRLKPDAPWVELNFQISIDPEMWARERGIPPERINAEFCKLVDEIKEEAVGRGIGALATVSPELRGPLVS
ncbi:MAG: hypothetical protein JWP76_3404 [Dactylosporangium sp.]|jgi:hypothetical protein|nr:hypothetical protein [Dactylosporangium sp.]